MIRDLMTPGLMLPLGRRAESRPTEPAGPAGRAARTAVLVIEDITFRSDHDKLTDHKEDWEPGGKRYPKPEWRAASGETPTVPVSHSMYGELRLEVGVRYNAPPGAVPLSVTLTGKTKVKVGVAGELKLTSRRVVLDPGRNTVKVRGAAGFPAKVQKLNLTIDWRFEGAGVGSDPAAMIPAQALRTSHEVLVTMGEPETVDPFDKGREATAITYRRLAYAIQAVGALDTIDPHKITEKLLKGMGEFELGNLFANAWRFAEKRASVDCRTIVQYITNVIKIIGCPGKAEVVLVFPRLKNKTWPGRKRVVDGTPVYWLSTEPGPLDFEAVAEAPPDMGNFAGLDRPALVHPDGEGKAILFDFGGGQNAFEGCLRFTRAGLTRYYAGGVGAFENKEQVLGQSFQSFSWGYLDRESKSMKPGKAIMPPWP